MNDEIFRTALVEEAGRHRIAIPAERLDALCAYYEFLRVWNARIRLVGTVAPERAAVELFADSLIACEFARRFASTGTAPVPGRVRTVVDIGSGAGLPGIPAKIMSPDWSVTFVESDAKKCSFLNHLARELGLSDIRIERRRAERLGHEPSYREAFDLAFCRAVAAPASACELAIPFLAKNGSLIIQTTARENHAGRETIPQSVRPAAEMLGATICQYETYALSSTPKKRLLIRVGKRAKTPKEFPRDARSIKKKPLA
jgi:16S rRNA (guanine527-N7)-methyltransferase